MRRPHKVDLAQPAITAALRARGFLVLVTSQLGHGAPDLIVYHRGRKQVWHLEVKSPGKKLTPDEVAFAASGWPVHVVRSVAEVLALVGAERRVA